MAPGGILDTHDEIRTINRNALIGMDYALDPTWALSLQVPVVQRNHRHIHNDVPPEYESWDFIGLGDMRMTGRYQKPLSENAATEIQFGLKLPTGKFNETNNLDLLAERSLRPGSGTTDLLLGAYSYHRLEGEATTLVRTRTVAKAFGGRERLPTGTTTDARCRTALRANAQTECAVAIQSAVERP